MQQQRNGLGTSLFYVYGLIKTCASIERWRSLTYGEFLAELEQAALTVREFAALVHMHPNSVSNYARAGEVPTHLAVIAALLAELRRNAIDHQPIFARIRIAAKRPRGGAEPGRFGGNPQGRLGL